MKSSRKCHTLRKGSCELVTRLRMRAHLGSLAGLLMCVSANLAIAEPSYKNEIPAAVRGPFISNPRIVAELDCPGGVCGGPLDFSRLIHARAETSAMKEVLGKNPFNLKIGRQIRETIEADLDELSKRDNVAGHQLQKKFLTDDDSKLELVGVVNRMDRQFIHDTSQRLTKDQLACGELSLIYRFGYSLHDRDQKSRLPVTANVVLPALPSDTRGGTVTCKSVARRWLNAIPSFYTIDDRSPKSDVIKVANALFDANSGPLAFISGRDILRIELNIQAYRIPGQIAKDFGTEASYVIRVFKWIAENGGYFDPDFLPNQVDRDRVLCRNDKPAVCAEKEKLRKQLVASLTQPKVMQDIDWGTFEIDPKLDVLSKRGISISPGGSHRSNNQVYWNAKSKEEQIISDPEIYKALQAAAQQNIKFSFIKTVDDFRARLNETTCTGCHQTRAIAGFHFPGADRGETSPVNSVFLPGSSHFYGDQPRRLEILKKIADGQQLTRYELATGYSARPMNRFREALAGTELIGGWGGACLMDNVKDNSQRKWTCRPGLQCTQVFKSDNDNGIGTCLPERAESSPTLAVQLGDALQKGEITSKRWGRDSYNRNFPNVTSGEGDEDTVIPLSALPKNTRTNNSYYGAHQEFHTGHADWNDKDLLRDADTGGFPGGMLRLSECTELSGEATCGLIASTGFNKCIEKLGDGAQVDGKNYSIDICFKNFTSFAGLRACTVASPCRDDYICVKPMGYDQDHAKELFKARKQLLTASKFFPAVNNNHLYDPTKFYGQVMPDNSWLDRNDQRGLCIPPYFVFQFRADGHPKP